MHARAHPPASARARRGAGAAVVVPLSPAPLLPASRRASSSSSSSSSTMIASTSASSASAAPPSPASARSWHPHHQQRQQRHRHHRCRPSLRAAAAASSSSPSDGERAYGNLFNARIFADPERQSEFERCMSDLRQLSMMSSKFPEMDTAGKRFFLQAMEESSERYRIFIKRLELAKGADPAAAEYLAYTSQQMEAGGFSIGAMFEGLAQSLGRYRQIVDAEERAEAAGPVEAQRFREALRQEWGQSALGAIDMGQLAEMVPPEVIARAQADPQFYVCIKEISESPTPDVLARWISHEKIGPLVTAMSKLILQKRGLGGVGGSG